MPEARDLTTYLRGNTWWVKGRRPDSDRYIRESLGTSDETLADAKVEEIYREARKRRILGPDAPKVEDELTFDAAALHYQAPPGEALYLKKLLKRYGRKRIKEMTPEFIRQIGPKMLPYASTDTWHREIVTPIRSVINNAHALGYCPPIRVQRFSEAEMVKQDVLRGKQSRVPKKAGSWPWLLAFMEHAAPRDGALAYFMFRHGYRLTQSIEMTRSRDMDLSAGKVFVHASKGHAAHWVDLDPEEVAMIANLPVPYRGQARDRVFTIAGGRSGALYARWKATCAAAGIDYLPPHSSGRHGYGTEMVVRQKVDPVSAADDKWSDPSVMLKTYAHSDNAKAIVRDAFRAGLEAARTPAVQPVSQKQVKQLRGKAK
jgi:integrase